MSKYLAVFVIALAGGALGSFLINQDFQQNLDGTSQSLHQVLPQQEIKQVANNLVLRTEALPESFVGASEASTQSGFGAVSTRP